MRLVKKQEKVTTIEEVLNRLENTNTDLKECYQFIIDNIIK